MHAAFESKGVCGLVYFCSIVTKIKVNSCLTIALKDSLYVSFVAKLQLNSQLHLHSKSIQLLQELSWSYALYLVFTTTSP